LGKLPAGADSGQNQLADVSPAAWPVAHVAASSMHGCCNPHAFEPLRQLAKELKQKAPPPFGTLPAGWSRVQTNASPEAPARPVLQSAPLRMQKEDSEPVHCDKAVQADEVLKHRCPAPFGLHSVEGSKVAAQEKFDWAAAPVAQSRGCQVQPLPQASWEGKQETPNGPLACETAAEVGRQLGEAYVRREYKSTVQRTVPSHLQAGPLMAETGAQLSFLFSCQYSNDTAKRSVRSYRTAAEHCRGVASSALKR
jgi:hypothetical protein